jgi:hypothetical protein
MRIRRIGAALGIGVLLAGCGATGTSTLEATRAGVPSAGPTGSGSAPASSSGSPAETPSVPGSFTAGPTATPLPAFAPLSLARVTVSTLNVRVAPSASAKLIEPPAYLSLTLPLVVGARVLVLAGPVQADGYAWYAVGLAQDASLTTAGIQVGWVAGASGTTPWLVSDTAGCPTPGVTAIAALSGIERIGCFGARSLAFGARQTAEPPDAGFGGACGPPPGQPGWLVCDNVNHSWVNADGGTTGLLLLHFDPATGIAPTGLAPVNTTGPAYRIAGHFDDTAAQACGVTTDPADLEQMSAWLTCASKFVVETLSTS